MSLKLLGGNPNLRVGRQTLWAKMFPEPQDLEAIWWIGATWAERAGSSVLVAW